MFFSNLLYKYILLAVVELEHQLAEKEEPLL